MANPEYPLSAHEARIALMREGVYVKENGWTLGELMEADFALRMGAKVTILK
ncbi:MAG: hypothetical protein IPK63_15590 [Candidatus Competibacteraceae bacterium]|nr:hypothetical protein [Candidatus Competibacteraceae bacterium]